MIQNYNSQNPLPIAVLISGNGSNLQAIIDAIAKGLPVEIKIVISNNPQAYGLERAKQAHIPTHVLQAQDFPTRVDYDKELIACLDQFQPRLIILAGFMRILSALFIEHFNNRILNIHPALLPKYPGLNTHQMVYNNKDKIHGSTVHVVTEHLDAGPIIAQSAFAVDESDDPASLTAKIKQLEHKLYPHVLALYAQGKLDLHQDKVFYEGKLLPKQGLQLSF